VRGCVVLLFGKESGKEGFIIVLVRYANQRDNIVLLLVKRITGRAQLVGAAEQGLVQAKASALANDVFVCP
jgi:hypothetical protein